MRVEIDRSFNGNFDCELLEEIPIRGVEYYFPDRDILAGRDGILLKVTPCYSTPWVGMFSSVQKYPGALSEIFFMPDPEALCVVTSGDAVIVKVSNPKSSLLVDFEPVMGARIIQDPEMIILAGFTKLIGIDRTGVKWRTTTISWDDLKLESTVNNRLEGSYMDVSTEKRVPFSVNLFSGEVKGSITTLRK